MTTPSDSNEDYKDINDVFFKNFIKNYLNFPAKLQRKDNVRSIFDEVTFKNLPHNYISLIQDFQLQQQTKGGIFTRNEAHSLQDLLIETKNYPSAGYKVKSELASPDFTPMSQASYMKRLKSTPGSQNASPTMGFEQSKVESVQSEPLKNAFKKFLDIYKGIIGKEAFERASTQEPEVMVNVLNSMFSSSSGDYNDPHQPLFLFFEEGTVFSLLDLGTRPDNSVNSKVILRNVTGKYAWEFKHIRAVLDKGLVLDKPRLQDINAHTFYTNLAMRGAEEEISTPQLTRKSSKMSESYIHESEDHMIEMADQPTNELTQVEISVKEVGSEIIDGEFTPRHDPEGQEKSFQEEQEKKVDSEQKLYGTGERDRLRIRPKESSELTDRFEEILLLIKSEIEDYNKVHTTIYSFEGYNICCLVR